MTSKITHIYNRSKNNTIGLAFAFSIGLLLATSCARRHFYQIGGEGTISREYYDTCMGFVDLGKQLAGSIRSGQLAGTEDVCGCQAELIYRHGIYVAQEPQSSEFQSCARNLVANSRSDTETAAMGSGSDVSNVRGGFPLLPLLLGIGILGGGGIFLAILNSQSED